LKNLFVLLSLLVSTFAWAQEPSLFDYSKSAEYEIADVKVEGAKFLDPKILVTLSGLAKGD